jgi:hypothetical protein
VILAKLALLWVGLMVPALLPWALWTAVILGGIISHAPGVVRQYGVWGEAGPCARKADGACALPRGIDHGGDAIPSSTTRSRTAAMKSSPGSGFEVR